MKINKMIKIISLCLILVLFVVGCTKETKDVEGSDVVIATVNGVEIYQDTFDKNVALYSMEYIIEFGEDILNRPMQSGLTLLEEIREQVMDRLLMEEVLIQLATEKNITVEDKEIKDGYQEFQESLMNNQDIKQFADKNGIDEAFIKNEIRKDKMIRLYQEQFFEELAMDHEKAKKHYDENPEEFINHEVKASHILVTDEELANQLYDRISAGESFEELALEYSEDPGSRIKGGDLGYFPRGVMIEEFEKVAFALEVGKMSFPVNTVFGYHIIRTDDKRSEVIAFEDIKDELVIQLENMEFRNHMTNKLDQSEVVILNQ